MMNKKVKEAKEILSRYKSKFLSGEISKEQYDRILIELFDKVSETENELIDFELIIKKLEFNANKSYFNCKEKLFSLN